MMTPQTAARQLLGAFLLGLALGLVYGFLRPLSRRRRILGDGIFLLALGWAVVYLAFGI